MTLELVKILKIENVTNQFLIKIKNKILIKIKQNINLIFQKKKIIFLNCIVIQHKNMDANEFRVKGKEIIDYIADYLENIG